jgi:uncharacterized protein YdhG (YjbR/CyaY superfamily)
MKPNPTATDGYLAALLRDQRAALEEPRAAIKAAAPGAREYVSSGVPAFEDGGKYLVGFGAAERHVALYVMRGSTLAALKDDLEAQILVVQRGPRNAPPLGPRFHALLTEEGADEPAPLGLLRRESSY